MNRFSLITVRYLCGIFLLTSAVHSFADEASAPEQAQETQNAASKNISVGTRRMSHADHVAIQEKRAQEARQAAKESGEDLQEDMENQKLSAVKSILESKESRLKASVANLKPLKASLYVTTHQGVYHNPLSVGVLGESVTLEDGSVWSVSSDDTYKTLNWLTSDLIVVSPNHAWFSVYDYVITNQNTGVSVKANLILGPIVDAVYRHWVVAIDYLWDRVWLEDGSIWTLFDSSISKQWQVGDTVIIGVNDGWFSTSYPNILINVNMLNYTRCICTY